MPRNASQIAQDIAEMMRKNAVDVVTMKWPDFYKLAERDRIKEGFMGPLKSHLLQESIMLSEGNAVVAFVKDFDFSPLKRK